MGFMPLPREFLPGWAIRVANSSQGVNSSAATAIASDWMCNVSAQWLPRFRAHRVREPNHPAAPGGNKTFKNFDIKHFFSRDTYPPNRRFKTGLSIAGACSKNGQTRSGRSADIPWRRLSESLWRPSLTGPRHGVTRLRGGPNAWPILTFERAVLTKNATEATEGVPYRNHRGRDLATAGALGKP